MSELTGIIVPVVVATLLSVSGAIVVARYSGPAQQAYIAALQGRLSVVEQERDDAEERIPKLEARITVLETQVAQLIGQNVEKDREIAMLYRRLDADEKRLNGR